MINEKDSENITEAPSPTIYREYSSSDGLVESRNTAEEKLSDDSPELSEDRTQMSRERTDMAQLRTDLADLRTELAEKRTHLSNERTFQAWIRTSLSMIGFGFLIERFVIYIRRNEETMEMVTEKNSGTYSMIVGIILIFIGILLIIVAYLRYRHTAGKIGPEDYVSSKWISTLVMLSIVAGGILILLDLFVSL